ncbi:MAG: hypothetical protein COT26_00160 [Candidatus Kerfeldbacteria bacterium CG08_land_8_20_14_0_20_43_14]|uniref:Uncharacterized protein n=1 Tax=Candidatus Kerfeldbacteria bacterium CG08_land_8_20_14_0_20_43_14 TaxID=2014246 RepID=A0A2H0YTF4_9BACT|nr:MAG: hypothetical protein COT26_00160 [Candidatus Kerfeldbacteria bacterium CG08_land_8_20_14_0_20_43_14]
MLVVKDSDLLHKTLDGYFLGLNCSFRRLIKKIVKLKVDQHDLVKAEKLRDFLQDAIRLYSFFRSQPFSWDHPAGLAAIDQAINAAMADEIEEAMLYLQQAEKWRAVIISDLAESKSVVYKNPGRV